MPVTDNADDSPQTASLSGTGTASAATLPPPSGSSLFPYTTLFRSPQTVTLSNTGTAPLTISGIALGGTNAGDFGQTNNCPLSPSTLAASSSCTFNVTFTPTASGTCAASLTVTDNASGSPQTVSLTGTGTAPAVSLSPT